MVANVFLNANCTAAPSIIILHGITAGKMNTHPNQLLWLDGHLVHGPT
jgi:hypothetical protein